MLKIRKEQMEALAYASRQRFLKKTILHVRKVFPEQTEKTSNAELLSVIENGLKRAEAYQVVGKREVTLFIDLMFGLGKDFDRRSGTPWIKQVLDDPEFDQQQKIDLIYKRLQAAGRQTAGNTR